MAELNGPYVAFRIGWTVSGSTSFDVFRRVGLTGAVTQVGSGVPILGTLPDGRAFWMDTTAPIGEPLYYRFVGSTGAVINWVGPFVLPDVGATWLTDPVRPWADIRMDTCPPGEGNHRPDCPNTAPEFVWGGFTGTLDMPVDAGLFDILNAEHPADVFARRKYAEGGFRFFTTTLDAIDRVYDLFTAGGVLLLRTPPEYGWHQQFIQPGTPEMAYVSRDQRRPERMWDVPFTVVDQPFGPIQGTDCNNWCDVRSAFPTFAQMTAYPGTWYDLADGSVLCPSLPPGEDGFGLGGFGSGPFGDGG